MSDKESRHCLLFQNCDINALVDQVLSHPYKSSEIYTDKDVILLHGTHIRVVFPI